MPTIAFIGFRHGHIDDLHARALAHPDLRIVACCEEDAATREHLANQKTIHITHDNYAKMLAEVSADILAVGDYYAVRGSRIIDALRVGKHVIIDKPICTRLAELDEIEELTRTQELCLGAMLDMRDHGLSRALRRLIRAGEIGAIQAISFGGQHPLNGCSYRIL